MNSLVSLVCCAEFLVALLLMPAWSSVTPAGTSTVQTATDNNTVTQYATNELSQNTTPDSSTSSDTTTNAISKATSALHAAAATTSTTTTKSSFLGMDMKNCSTALLVAGGLIIGFVILLILTLVLACKVCSLSRRLKALSSNSDMVSNREYWMGNDKEDKNKSEARETTVLMSDITQTQEEMSNGAAKEEGDKAKEDGQTAGEKEEGGGGGAVSEEASAAPAAAESPSSPNPQEEAANSEPSNATAAAAPAAASSSEGNEEPKDGQ